MDSVSQRIDQMKLETSESSDFDAYFQSPSYSPLESPVRLESPKTYLDIFGECIKCVETVLDSMETLNNSIVMDESQGIKRELSVSSIQERESASKKVKKTANRTDKFVYFKVKENNHELVTFFKLTNNRSFDKYCKPTLKKTFIKFEANEFTNYYSQLIEHYFVLLNMNLIFSQDFDFTLAKYYLSKYVHILKSSHTHDDQFLTKFSYILMINYCFTLIDLLGNCSYSSGKWYLDGLHEKQIELLGNEYYKLVSKQTRLDSPEFRKIQIICELLQEAKVLDIKVIIIIDRNIQVLYDELKMTIEFTVEIKCSIVQNTHSIMCDDKALCFLIKRDNLTTTNLNFIYIEYESLTENVNSTLNCLTFEKYSYRLTKPSLREQLKQSVTNRYLIISSKISSFSANLINKLERDLDFSVILRDYDELQVKFKLKSIHFAADILINESSGILIYDLNELLDLEKFQLRLEYLKFQLDQCHVIIFNVNQLKLKLNLIQIISSINKLKLIKIQMIHLSEPDKLLCTIGTIYLRQQRRECAFELSELDCSLNEIFLLSFGCFNSFSSQYLLNIFSLKVLMNCNYDTLVQRCSSHISPRLLEIFLKFLPQQLENSEVK